MRHENSHRLRAPAPNLDSTPLEPTYFDALLAQGFRLQHALDLLVAVEAGHPEEDPARHMLKVLYAQGQFRGPWEEVVGHVHMTTTPEVEIGHHLSGLLKAA